MKNDTKNIYILLSFTGTVLSRIIKIITQKEFAHVSVSLDSEFDSFYSFGRLKPRNPFVGGFVKEDINSGSFKYFKNTKCKIYSLEVSEKKYDDLDKIISLFLSDKELYKFNVIGLATSIINKPVNRKYKYFCSQFVSKAFLDSNIYDFKKDVGLVTPTDFLDIPNLKELYSGKLSNYQS